MKEHKEQGKMEVLAFYILGGLVKYKLGVEIINTITTNKKTKNWIEYESFPHAQSKAGKAE